MAPVGEEMAGFEGGLKTAWWVLRLGVGVGPILAGADKFFNRLTDWTMYLSPVVTKVVPVSATTLMHAVGVIEIVAGILVLTRWTRIASYIVALWLVAISVNLLTTGLFYDLAVRDVEIAVGAFALAQLTAYRERCLETVPPMAEPHPASF